MFVVLTAMVLAIGFSAFTPEKAPPEIVYYDLGGGAGWEPIDNPCPTGEMLFCKVTIDGQSNVQLYRNQDLQQPVRYDP